jgi:Carboxypeptidase regulatory-like domain
MNHYACITYIFALVLSLDLLVCAQTDPRTGSVSGRVTINGKPAANKKINITGENSSDGAFDFSIGRPEGGQSYSAMTDGDGRYRITGLPAGTFTLEAQLPAYVDEKKSGSRQRSITLDRGEQVENVDLSLVRGGVITGRITDSKGNPLIAKQVRLQIVKEEGARDVNLIQAVPGLNDFFETDDRGIYRAYGLPEGKYLVSVGSGVFGDVSHKYPLTYHPDATDEKQATIIDVREGSEATGIDIRIVSETETYEALGRVIDADTGEPVPQASLVCIKTEESGAAPENLSKNAVSDAQGNFRFTGLPSGRYSVSLSPEFFSSKPGEYYTEENNFSIAGSNLSGVEVRARRGGAISGVVVFENSRDPARTARPAQLMLTAVVTKRSDPQPAFGMSGQSATKINSDGSFRVSGLSPGEVKFGVFSFAGGRSPELVRVERDGSQVVGNLEIKRGEVISGVRLVLALGTGVIRGQVEIVGGGLPDDATLQAIANRAGTLNSDGGDNKKIVDKKGRFVFEGLLDGEYEVIVLIGSGIRQSIPPAPTVSQKVSVISGSEAQVNIKLDLSQGRQQ